MAIIAHWRIITAPEEEEDGVFHTVYTGAYAPTTPCGIRRGGKVWHEEVEPLPELLCEVCVQERAPDVPGPEDSPAP